MNLVVVICVAAAMGGAIAPICARSRPRLALLVAAIVPVLALYARYLAVGRDDDWEGMGAMALLIVAGLWVLVSLLSGGATLLIKRWIFGARL